jgi:hypothetical protein
MTRDALVVGINQYPFLKDSPTSKSKHLKTPAGDAEAIAQLLETYGNFRVQRLPASVIEGKLQVDPNKTVRAEELQAAIANLFRPKSGRTPETALLFFAGHGLRNIKGEKSEGYLATSDANPRRDIWGIPLQWLRQLLQESSVRQQIIWLDCCFSGELLNFKETELGGQWLGCDREASHKDRFFLAASRDYEVAYQQLDGEHGVLSGAILKGLDPYQDPGYEWITNSTLTGAVEREIERSKIPQSPLVVNYGEKIHLIQKKGRTPFITSEDFFRGWLDSDKPFNHAWKLEGRTDYLQSLNEFVESRQERIAILPGRGGIGKTKLLHAFAENFEHSECILRFVEEGVSVTRENIDNLPARPCVVVLDDAHRREQDVSTLLTLVQQRTNIKLLLSSRPYAVNYLQKLLRDAGTNSRQIQQLDELRELSREEVKALARQALGREYAHLASQLASVTKDCPLVTVVGGRLLAEKAIPPGLLERDEDFQHDVLMRFQDEFVGKVSQRIEPTLCRKLLKLIAAVAPIRLTNEFFKQVSAEFLKIECSELVNYIGILEQSGILLRRGDTLRITPDVLADHILNEACLTPHGESTGYTQEVFKKFQDICPTAVLRNLAELDWRIRHTSDVETDLLADIWQEIREEFRKASNSGRYRLLELLKEVAYHQPKQTLRLVELAMREPATTPEDQTYSDFYTHSRVLYQLPELLRRISHNLEYFPRCYDLLWRLGRDNSQEFNSYPKHARHVLIELAKYDIDKPPIFNQKVVEAVTRWLKKPNANTHIDILLDILDPLLAKSFYWTRTEGFNVNFSSSYVSREKTQSIHDQALTLISQCLDSEQPKVILRALKSLKEALEEPRDFFSQKHIEQVEQWIPEQLKILQLISDLTVRESNPLIHLEIVKTLDWHAQHSSSPIVKERSQAILTSILDSYELRLTAVLTRSYDLDWLLQDEEKNRSDYETYDQHINELCLTIVRGFLERHPEAYEGVRSLNNWLQNIIDLAVQPEPSKFFSNLCKVIESSYATEMCKAIIEIGDCPLALYLAYLLERVRIADVNRAIAISQRALDTKTPVLCAAVAQVYRFCRENLQPDDFELVKNLLADTHFGVKLLAIDSLKILGRLEPKSTIDLALNVDISDSTELASRLCQVFDTDYGIPPETLTDEELDTLLKKLEPTVNIDEYHISEFLAYLSKRLPHSVARLFLNRIKRDEEDKKGNYQPLPFQGFQHRLEGIAESKEYKDILRNIRNQALHKTCDTKFWFSKLFRDVSLVSTPRSSTNQSSFIQETIPTRYSYEDEIFVFSPISIEVLSEWVNSEDRNKIQGISCLLRNAPQAFVFQNVEFVSNLLEQAYELGDDCYTTVTIDLLNSVNSGGRSGTPAEPLPEDVALKEQSAAVAKELVAESPSHRFYDCLAKDAKAHMEYWEKMWEEFGEQ